MGRIRTPKASRRRKRRRKGRKWKGKEEKGKEGMGRGEKLSYTRNCCEPAMWTGQTKDGTGFWGGTPDESAELLGSSCVRFSQCATIILLQVMGTWRSQTFQIKHKHPFLNSSDPFPIESIYNLGGSRLPWAPLSRWTYSKQFLKGCERSYQLFGKPSSFWHHIQTGANYIELQCFPNSSHSNNHLDRFNNAYSRPCSRDSERGIKTSVNSKFGNHHFSLRLILSGNEILRLQNKGIKLEAIYFIWMKSCGFIRAVCKLQGNYPSPHFPEGTRQNINS